MHTRTEPQIQEHMATLAEPVRSRLVFLLEKEELTVSDLCAVLQLPQSTVSRHLKTLLNRGWVDSRPEGTRRLYRGTVEGLDAVAVKLWALTLASLEQDDATRSDVARLQSVLARRRGRSREFFEASGDRWDSVRDEMFGDRFSLEALMSLFPDAWTVADLGCGTGRLMEAMAPWVKRVIGVDTSQAMLDLANERLASFDSVELRRGELETLPIGDGELDAATLMLVLHHLEHPRRAIGEAARCLNDRGTIVIVDLVPHDHIEYQQDMGHVWLGFSREQIDEFLKGTGFATARYSVLPPAPDAKGPNLFVVSASKRSQ